MLVNNVSSDSELGIYLVNKGITPFPDRFKPYINYARVGAEYREKHGGEYSSGNYVQKKTPELLENERLDGVFRIWMENPCPVRVQSETAQITLPATFEQLESARQLLGVDSLNMAKLTRVEALRPYLGEYLPLQGMDLRLEQLDELAENIRIMDQEDGALLKYLSVLEVEQPATLQEALRFSIELDDYQMLSQDSDAPVYRMRAITDALQKSGAKTVNVTVQKDGVELTFKTSAESLKGLKSQYSTWYIAPSDRLQFRHLFGAGSDYSAEDIIRIAYGRSTLYEAPSAPAEDTEVFSCFIYRKRVFFPNRHVGVTHSIVPLSILGKVNSKRGFNRTAVSTTSREFHPCPLRQLYPMPATLLTLGLWL